MRGRRIKNGGMKREEMAWVRGRERERINGKEGEERKENLP